jgi:hypothetical protein
MHETPDIPLEGLCEGKEQVAEGRDHGPLMVGIAWHEGRPVFLPPFPNGFDQKDQFFDEDQHLFPEIQTHIQGDLVIPASPCMDFSSGFHSNLFNQGALDVRMDIFFERVQMEGSLLVQPFYRPEAS